MPRPLQEQVLRGEWLESSVTSAFRATQLHNRLCRAARHCANNLDVHGRESNTPCETQPTATELRPVPDDVDDGSEAAKRALARSQSRGHIRGIGRYLAKARQRCAQEPYQKLGLRCVPCILCICREPSDTPLNFLSSSPVLLPPV